MPAVTAFAVAGYALAFRRPFATPHTGDQTQPAFELTFSGPEEADPSPSAHGIQWVPDGNVAFVRRDGLVHAWLSGGTAQEPRSTFYLRGPSWDALLPEALRQGTARSAFGPSRAGFDADYAGPGSVIADPSGDGLTLIYHGEDQGCHTPGNVDSKAGIGAAVSRDGGRSWTRSGQILGASDLPRGCGFRGFRGVGNPSAVLDRAGQHVLVYFNEWVPGRPDGVSVARAPRDAIASPAAWTKYRDGGFTEPGIGRPGDVVIDRASPAALHVGVPHVSFNTYLDRYLAIVAGADGFSYASSSDGIHWDQPRRFWSVPALTSPELRPGQVFYYYPTLVDTASSSSDRTGQTGYLYYARGVRDAAPHRMYRRAVMLKQWRIRIPAAPPPGKGSPPPPTSAPGPAPTSHPTVAPSRTPPPTATPPPTPTPIPGKPYPPGARDLIPYGWAVTGDVVVEGMALHDSVDETGLAVHCLVPGGCDVTFPHGGWGDPLTERTFRELAEGMLISGCAAACARVRMVYWDGAPRSEWIPSPPPGVEHGAGTTATVANLWAVSGDVVVDGVELHDNDPATGLVVMCERPQGCTVAFPFKGWSDPLADRTFERFAEELLAAGCTGRCASVRMVWWNGGIRAERTIR